MSGVGTFFSKDIRVANGRVIRPGATCAQAGGVKTFATRPFPAGTLLVLYGDMETQTPFELVCTCGQTPCTYMGHIVPAAEKEKEKEKEKK